MEFDFTIEEDVPWEVGPGAVYNALAYNGRIPGPTIEATAGDRISIRLTNNSTEAHSIHTHVVEFDYENDGVDSPSLVMPGETRTIEWKASYPGTFPYHDHGDEAQGIALGLFGAVIVHAPDEEPATEHLVVLSDFEQSNYDSLPGVADPQTGEFPDAGTYRGGHQYMHTINGKAYEDAVPEFSAKMGELVRWRIVSIGQEFHTWHIHG
ncbi:MAG TPA: multicopper oxidase domain-containing protein, partial [Polyangiaceae bacterium]|nr:multicopper oxidase domain-containing protein [Polyangiaceae bacterium]